MWLWCHLILIILWQLSFNRRLPISFDNLVATRWWALLEFYHVSCLIVRLSDSCLALWSCCWRGGDWSICFTLVCGLCTVCVGMSVLSIGATGRLCFVIVALPGHLLKALFYVGCGWYHNDILYAIFFVTVLTWFVSMIHVLLASMRHLLPCNISPRTEHSWASLH